MMINKRLIGAVPESKKYIAGNVALQWCSLCANIAMMSAVTALLAALFAGEVTQSKIVTTAVIALAAVAVRYGCTVGASRMGYLSSKAVKKTLRGAIYDKLLCLGASYSEQVKTSEVVHRLQKRNWWNYFRFNGNYSYGRYNVIGNASDEFTPMYQTTMSSAQHNFNVGASVGISLGELFNRPLKLKDYRYQIEQLQYSQEEVMEQRKLRVLEAYNAVTEQLATIKAKAESAALYNAQMKISENNFIQGTIDIISLSLERARRSGAVVSYEQARVALHNSIVLLEMLTNVKVIKDK